MNYGEELGEECEGEENVDAPWAAGDRALHQTKGFVTIIKVGSAAADFFTNRDVLLSVFAADVSL